MKISKRKTRSDKFPLTLHPTGQYCKKIRGKIRYFGKDKKKALEKYLTQATYLHGAQSLAQKISNGKMTLKQLWQSNWPIRARRHVKVTDQRTRKDFAECIREPVDVHYPDAEKIVLVLDNLNTHSTGSLYEAFEPTEARRLAEKLEIHHTPKHGSWLNMVEIEIGVLSRQCLSQYIPTKGQMINEVAAWEQRRNQDDATVDWQFTTADARVKLKRLYPVI
jgi:hypothetical protein